MSFNLARRTLRNCARPKSVPALLGFFKTGKGQYAEGDQFIGVTVPEIRRVARQFQDLSLQEISKLLRSKIHEERLLALVILVNRMPRADENEAKNIFAFYRQHLAYVNNWDLVDASASYIVGRYLFNRDRKLLYQWAKSKELWIRRIAIVSTHYFIRNNDFIDTCKISKLLLKDQEDLIHKASGWMLREMGKKNLKPLRAFLDLHADQMPRTMLRYSLEKLDAKEKQYYMKMRS